MADPIRLLLVDDHAGELHLVRAELASEHSIAFEVEQVQRVAEATERLEAGGIDAVLLDLNLPDTTGVATFEALFTRAPDVPIVVQSGHDDIDLAKALVAKGAQDYRVKQPEPHGRLAWVIALAIERHRRQS